MEYWGVLISNKSLTQYPILNTQYPILYTHLMQQACVYPWCRQAFDVSAEDLALLDKLSPVFAGKKELLPPPTLCPDCRQQRRMAYRNERQLYRRMCDITGKSIISVFPPDAPYKVCDKDHWYSTAFDPFAYGRPYDPAVLFFDQLHALLLAMPQPSLRIEQSENCDFNNGMSACKDCYLCARTHQSQNMLYTYRGNKSHDSVDCTQSTKCSFLYGCTECVNCQDSRFLSFCNDCATSAFLFDCRSCMDCFLCCNLRNKRYCFGNEQLTREAYAARLQEFVTGSWESQQEMLRRFQGMRLQAIHPALRLVQCENVTGDNMQRCTNCIDCFSTQECQDCRHLRDVKEHRDCMDEYSGGRNSELMYETTAGAASYGVAFSLRATDSQFVLYSFYIAASKHIFGCMGLQRAQYCILNTQYTQGEYEALVPTIIAKMRHDGEWGEFLPTALSFFGYNDTVALDHFSLTEQQVLERGWRWQKRDDAIPDVSRVIEGAQLPDRIDEIPDDVLNWAIRCTMSQRPFKLTAAELAYYRQHRIPVPREHPDVRYRSRMEEQTPFTLWDRLCAKCQQPTATSFSPERPEIVFCTDCYLASVY